MNTNTDWSVQTTITIIGGVAAVAMVPGGALFAANATYPDVAEDY